MRLGYFTMPLHPMERNCTETLQEDREAIILADQLQAVSETPSRNRGYGRRAVFQGRDRHGPAGFSSAVGEFFVVKMAAQPLG